MHVRQHEFPTISLFDAADLFAIGEHLLVLGCTRHPEHTRLMKILGDAVLHILVDKPLLAVLVPVTDTGRAHLYRVLHKIDARRAMRYGQPGREDRILFLAESDQGLSPALESAYEQFIRYLASLTPAGDIT